MRIAVNKAHYPVTVLGPGRRIGIWVQGCSIHCKGCISQDTWEPDPGREMEIAQLVRWCKDTTGGVLDGVTISGGEPFDQPAALGRLLDEFIAWRKADKLEFDLLCYSGYPWSRLRKRHAKILDKLDAIIPEPFVDSLPQANLWRGSANQSLVPLSPRGRARYAAHLEAPAASVGKRIQAAVEGKRVWYIGIPARGDMPALEQLCAERGVNFSKVSWRQ
jgi:anaerobic ribonucleoside-triphosphate reductase activating protein